MNLIHLDHSIFAIAREPIKHPEVGTIRLVNASPSWNARTEVWRETPRRSASGAMIGMVIAACPEPDTTKKLNTDWKRYISTAANAPESPESAWEIPYMTVLITVGVVGSEPPRTCMIPCAIATTSAAPIRSFAPSLNEDAMSFSFILFKWKTTPITPETIPMMKNWVAISAI